MSIDTKASQIISAVTTIRSTYGVEIGDDPSIGADLEALEDSINDIETKVTEITDAESSKIISDLQSTSIGRQVGILSDLQMTDLSCNKYVLLSKLFLGDFLDQILDDLNSIISGGLTEEQLKAAVSAALADAAQWLLDVTGVGELIDQISGIIGELLSIVSGGAAGNHPSDLMNCAVNFFDVLEVKNPVDFNTLSIVKASQDLGQTATQVFESVITQSKIDRDIDNRVSNAVSEMDSFLGIF